MSYFAMLRRYRLALLASVAYLLAATLFSLFYLKDTRQYLNQMDAAKVQTAAKLTAQGIGFYYQGLEKELDIFVQGHTAEINQLYAHPTDGARYQHILDELRRNFPQIRSFTLATAQGKPVLADFDGFIGDLCRADIQTKAKHPNAQVLRLHPPPLFEHIDVMSEWTGPDGERRIFFINYAADSVARRLAELATPTVKQMLVLRTDPHLIEFTDKGARNAYPRQWVLDAATLDHMAYLNYSAVPGTRWDVLAFLDPAAHAATTRFLHHKMQQLIIFELVFGLLFVTLVWYLNHHLLRQIDRVEKLARRDELTGLYNHAWFVTRLEQSLQETARTGQRVAILFIDLNHFKPINDQYGHLAGDQVLQEIGRRLSTLYRQSDIVARYGGDEFVVALTQLNTAEPLARIVEKTQAAIDAPIVIDGKAHRVSASIGVAVQDEHIKSAQDLIHLADTRMYQQKKASRQAGDSR